MSENLLTPIEHATEGTQKYGFGRFVSIDHRDRNYLLPTPKSLDAAKAPTKFRYYMTAPALDQGDTSQCVAYSWTQFLLAAPVKNLPWKTPADLYHECQLRDEWPGQDYDGTSVRAGAKALQEFKYLSEYQWAFDAAAAANHILNVGPVVMGTNWYWEMFSPDKENFIHPEGALAGGHAYLIKGVNLGKKCPDGSLGAFRIINSWGTSWADKGMCWISFNDLDRLTKEWGEACTAKELKFKVEATG